MGQSLGQASLKDGVPPTVGIGAASRRDGLRLTVGDRCKIRVPEYCNIILATAHLIMDMSLDFQPGQIVSLEHRERNLYAEVIQVVNSRQLCWVRPLLLVTHNEDEALITDLRDGSDLLWPVNLFRPALDTEVITFLTQLLVKEPKGEIEPSAKQLLHQFINQLWQDYSQEQKAEND